MSGQRSLQTAGAAGEKPQDRLVLWRNKPAGRQAIGVAKRGNENRNAGGHTWHLVLKTSGAF